MGMLGGKLLDTPCLGSVRLGSGRELFVCPQDSSDTEQEEGEEHPCLAEVDGVTYLMTDSAQIPLPEGVEWELLKSPDGQYFIDSKAKDPSVKPRYVDHMERKYLARTFGGWGLVQSGGCLWA